MDIFVDLKDKNVEIESFFKIKKHNIYDNLRTNL